MSQSARFLLLGATGLVGYGIASYLLSRGHSVCGTSRRVLESRHENLQLCTLDLKTSNGMAQIKAQIDQAACIILNAAQLPGLQVGSSEFYLCNVIGLNSILGMVQADKHIILISGSSLIRENGTLNHYGSPFAPTSPYIASKIMSEILVDHARLATGCSASILRVTAPYGLTPTQPAILPRFISAVRSDQNLTLWGTGARKQAFTFTGDIGQACERAFITKAQGAYTICGDEVVTMKQLAELCIASYPNTSSKIVFEDKPDPQEDKRVMISNDAAKNELGFSPSTSLVEGLAKIHDYLDGKTTRIFKIAE